MCFLSVVLMTATYQSLIGYISIVAPVNCVVSNRSPRTEEWAASTVKSAQKKGGSAARKRHLGSEM